MNTEQRQQMREINQQIAESTDAVKRIKRSLKAGTLISLLPGESPGERTARAKRSLEATQQLIRDLRKQKRSLTA